MRDREALARELSNALRERLHWTYDDRALLSLVLIELARAPMDGGDAITLAEMLVQKLGSDLQAGVIEAHVRNLLWDNKEMVIEALRATSPLRGRSVREIAHKYCTCTCRDDPAVLQNHTNLCDSIADAILEYAASPPRKVIAISNGHHWIECFNLVCCRDCGFVRRADDQNLPCKGPVRVGIRQDS